jgi:hypothetical protein
LEQGHGQAVLDLTVEQLDEAGNTELLPWAILLGAIGDQPGELLQYTATWHHGHAMMRFLPAREGPARERPVSAEAHISDAISKYGGLQFKEQGFQFYKHPPAAAYNLNRLLFNVRHDAELRRRLLTDFDSVAAEYALEAEDRDAARAIAEVGLTPKISDNAERLVKAGAHPLHALMSLHAVHGEMKRLRNELMNQK